MSAKTAKHVTMRTNLARFLFIKGLDSFDFGYQPSVDRKQIQKPSLCHFVEHGENLVLLGRPGVGKTQLGRGARRPARSRGRPRSSTTRRRPPDTAPGRSSPTARRSRGGAAGRPPASRSDETWGSVPFEQRVHVGAWMPASYDPELRLIYQGTSVTSPAPKFMLGGIENTHLYQNSTLALDVDTGEIRWHYQHLWISKGGSERRTVVEQRAYVDRRVPVLGGRAVRVFVGREGGGAPRGHAGQGARSRYGPPAGTGTSPRSRPSACWTRWGSGEHGAPNFRPESGVSVLDSFSAKRGEGPSIARRRLKQPFDDNPRPCVGHGPYTVFGLTMALPLTELSLSRHVTRRRSLASRYCPTKSLRLAAFVLFRRTIHCDCNSRCAPNSGSASYSGS